MTAWTVYTNANLFFDKCDPLHRNSMAAIPKTKMTKTLNRFSLFQNFGKVETFKTKKF